MVLLSDAKVYYYGASRGAAPADADVVALWPAAHHRYWLGAYRSGSTARRLETTAQKHKLTPRLLSARR